MDTHRLLVDECGAPIVYVRTPLLPYEVAWKLYADDWEANLKQLLENNRLLRLAIRLASPSLARELAKWLAGQDVSSRAKRRLLAYALRASTRTTPFGLFAAIARVAVGEQTTLTLDSEMRTRTRIDMGWLGQLVAEWRDDANFRKKIRVTVNDAMVRRGDRYTSYHPLRTRRLAEKLLTYLPMSFKGTDAVRFLEGAACAPVTMIELADRLQAQYDEPADECFSLLEDLWKAGFFVDELGIDPTAEEPSREVLARVAAHEPERTADILPVMDAIAALDVRSPAFRTTDDYDAIDAMQLAILPKAEGTLQTDAVRQTSGVLSAEVLDDVKVLAHLMLRGPAMTLQGFRKRFVERYEGTMREVPLLELVHPSYGLGAPESPDHDPLPKAMLDRQTIVSCDALRHGLREIVIDGPLDTMMPELDEMRLATSFDFGFEIVADSIEALHRGDYLIATGGFTYAARAGAALGRFADALGPQARADLRAIASQLEALHQDAIVAELVALPSWSRGLNVSIRPIMHEHRVRVGFMNDDSSANVIPLEDLVVGLDDVGFYLRSVSMRKRVVLTESHVLNTAGTAPTISRFLSLLAYEGMVFPREYEWDCRVPFLPRVRCGRVVLRRACWTFSREALEAACSESLDAFARRWAMPRYVELVSHDNRLLIDTASEIGAKLLLDHVRTGRETIVLEEVFCTAGDVWLKESSDGSGFRAEFIASFARTALVKRVIPTSAVVSREERNYAAGSEWLYVKFYGDAHDEDRLLGERIAPVLGRLVAQGALEYWYFLRYADPRSHLRVRMKIVDGARPEVGASILDLLASLTRDGTIDTSGILTYEREIERYGGTEGMRVCEAIFAADSAHVLRHVVSKQLTNPDERIAFAARSIVEMALACSDVARGTFDPRSVTVERARLADTDRQNARAIKQTLRESRLMDPDLRSAISELASLELKGELTRPLASVVDSLVHMHANRCGLSGALELRARAIARQVLQSLEHERTTTK